MKKLSLLLAGIVIAASACTGRMTLLRNDQTGDMQRCEVSAQSEMLTGVLVSGHTQRKCVEAWKNAGYKEIH